MAAAFIATSVRCGMQAAAAILPAVVIVSILALDRGALSSVSVAMPALWASLIGDFVIVVHYSEPFSGPDSPVSSVSSSSLNLDTLIYPLPTVGRDHGRPRQRPRGSFPHQP
jgi:hypothetical protein